MKNYNRKNKPKHSTKGKYSMNTSMGCFYYELRLNNSKAKSTFFKFNPFYGNNKEPRYLGEEYGFKYILDEKFILDKLSEMRYNYLCRDRTDNSLVAFKSKPLVVQSIWGNYWSSDKEYDGLDISCSDSLFSNIKWSREYLISELRKDKV